MKNLRIGKVALGKKPVICGVLQDRFQLATLKRLHQLGIRLAELRIDQFDSPCVPDAIDKIRLLKRCGLSVIVTIRTKQEGGHWRQSEAERLLLFKLLLPEADAVDIELESGIAREVISEARRLKKPSIVSYHHFKMTPPERALREKLKRGKKMGASIIKLATFAKKKADFSLLFNFTTDYRKENLITISMGKLGEPSRVLFPFFGSLVTYGSAGEKTAPGQMTIEALVKVFEPGTPNIIK